MSKPELTTVHRAMKHAAWTVKNGTKEERSGRFLVPSRLVIARDSKTGVFVKAAPAKKSEKPHTATKK